MSVEYLREKPVSKHPTHLECLVLLAFVEFPIKYYRQIMLGSGNAEWWIYQLTNSIFNITIVRKYP